MKRMESKAASILVVIAMAFIGCERKSEYMNLGKKNAFKDGTSYSGMWKKGELEFIVLTPSRDTAGEFAFGERNVHDDR